MTQFDDYAALYNLMYTDKHYAAEAEFVLSQLAVYKKSVSSVLDLGCGTGTHALHFAETGCDVHGVDLSGGMLESAENSMHRRAKAVSQRVNLTLGDVRTVRLAKEFDAVVSLFHVMSYQTTDEDVDALIATARTHVAPGAPFLFDFWHAPAVEKAGPAVRRKDVEDETIKATRIARPVWKKDSRQVDVQYQFTVNYKSTGERRTFDELHTMRYFFPTELRDALSRGGFHVVECAEWQTGLPLTDDAFSAYIVALAI